MRTTWVLSLFNCLHLLLHMLNLSPQHLDIVIPQHKEIEINPITIVQISDARPIKIPQSSSFTSLLFNIYMLQLDQIMNSNKVVLPVM